MRGRRGAGRRVVRNRVERRGQRTFFQGQCRSVGPGGEPGRDRILFAAVAAVLSMPPFAHEQGRRRRARTPPWRRRRSMFDWVELTVKERTRVREALVAEGWDVPRRRPISSGSGWVSGPRSSPPPVRRPESRCGPSAPRVPGSPSATPRPTTPSCRWRRRPAAAPAEVARRSRTTCVSGSPKRALKSPPLRGPPWSRHRPAYSRPRYSVPRRAIASTARTMTVSRARLARSAGCAEDSVGRRRPCRRCSGPGRRRGRA